MSLSSINLSPRRPAIDAANLPELVEHYVVDSRLRVKPGTAATYDLMLSYLLGWWGEAGPALGYRLDRQGWALFEAWLGRQCSRQSHKFLTFNTRKSCLSRCKQMLRWAYRLGYLDRDFSDQIPQAKGNADLRTPPSLDDLARLMAAAGKSSRPLRDQAIVAVFIGTGIRRAEATALAVSDVQFHADGGGVIIVRVAKLDKPRKVAFDRVCGEYIAALLEGEGLIEGRLFRQWKGRDMSPASVYRVVKRACQVAGIDKRGRGPHDLRRAFATEWMRHRRGLADGQLLSMQMGHTSGAMTLRYSGLNFYDLEEGFTSPLSSM